MRKVIVHVLLLLLICLSAVSAYATGPTMQVIASHRQDKTYYLGIWLNEVEYDWDGYIWNWNELVDITIQNTDEMKAAYGGEPSFRIDQTSGPTLNVRTKTSDWDNKCSFLAYLNELPDGPTEATFRATCEWGGQTWTDTISVHIKSFPNGVPDGLGGPDEITTKVGETIEFDPVILPEGWTLPGHTPTMMYSGTIEYSLFFDDFAQINPASTDMHPVLDVFRSGHYRASYFVYVDEVTICKDIIVHVANEDGTMPPPEISVSTACDFGRFFYIGMDFVPHTIQYGKLTSDSYIDMIRIDNEQVLRKVLEGEPVWHVEAVPGAQQTAQVELLGSGCEVELSLVTMPAQPETAEYVITFEWDGVTWTGNYSIDFRLNQGGLPSGVKKSFGDYVILRVGDVIQANGRIEKMGMGLTGHYTIDEYETFFWDLSESLWKGVNREYADIAETPGVYRGYVEAGVDNIIWREPVTMIITRADGTLPAAVADSLTNIPLFTLPNDLQIIESEAFANLKEIRVKIPENTQEIDPDAFSGCGLVFLYTQENRDYFLNHDNIIQVTE